MEDAGESKAAQGEYEALGIQLFAPAPEGFDPLRAGDHELLSYGYSPRLNAQMHPELHKFRLQLNRYFVEDC
jgi:hypothetical protein